MSIFKSYSVPLEIFMFCWKRKRKNCGFSLIIRTTFHKILIYHNISWNIQYHYSNSEVIVKQLAFFRYDYKSYRTYSLISFGGYQKRTVAWNGLINFSHRTFWVILWLTSKINYTVITLLSTWNFRILFIISHINFILVCNNSVFNALCLSTIFFGLQLFSQKCRISDRVF